MGYPFGQSQSLSWPCSLNPSCPPLTVRTWETEKSWPWVSMAQQELKHQCFISIILSLNAKHSLYQLLRRDFTLSQPNPGPSELCLELCNWIEILEIAIRVGKVLRSSAVPAWSREAFVCFWSMEKPVCYFMSINVFSRKPEIRAVGGILLTLWHEMITFSKGDFHSARSSRLQMCTWRQRRQFYKVYTAQKSATVSTSLGKCLETYFILLLPI